MTMETVAKDQQEIRETVERADAERTRARKQRDKRDVVCVCGRQ